MCGKSGIVSASPHTPIKTTEDPSFFWFSEIEAAWAFLLNNSLEKLYIEKGLACSKYPQKLQELHPQMIIEPLNAHTKAAAIYVPTLEEIFSKGEVSTLYQPIVLGDRAKIHGFEALSRFVFDKKSLSPEFVFNYAQEKLVVSKYDRVCIELSLKLAPKSLVFINIRPQTLIEKDFTAWFLALLKKYSRPIEQVVLEVTEQHCYFSEQELTKRCFELKNFGLRFAIDDFGTGLANLSLLEMVNPSYLKISGRFSKNIQQDPKKQKIMKNILDLAHAFGLSAVVECVESLEDWIFLQKLGTSLAQGFYFFKPMTSVDAKKVAGA